MRRSNIANSVRKLAKIVGGGLAGLFFATCFTGCVSKAKANAHARAAFLAGQQQAMTRPAEPQPLPELAQGPVVTVNGPVKKHFVPWNPGMTLSQALLAAEYTSLEDPGAIAITREGHVTLVTSEQLLGGRDVALQDGDLVQILQRVPAPAQTR